MQGHESWPHLSPVGENGPAETSQLDNTRSQKLLVDLLPVFEALSRRLEFIELAHEDTVAPFRAKPGLEKPKLRLAGRKCLTSTFSFFLLLREDAVEPRETDHQHEATERPEGQEETDHKQPDCRRRRAPPESLP